MTASFTVLLVDDEAEVLEALRRTLRREGYRLLTAASASEAERLAGTEAVDIVISDVDMPGMTGLELLSRLRVSHPHIVRIVLSGAATLDSALKAINSGEVHRFLTKPWNKDELLSALRDAAARLVELRRTATADGRARAHGQLLSELERHYPGFGAADRRAGVYVISQRRIAQLLERIGDAPLSRLLNGTLP